jgi:hypothetical protein
MTGSIDCVAMDEVIMGRETIGLVIIFEKIGMIGIL